MNPKGGGKLVELRTSDSKRFYANRNNLLVLLKNCQHILLLLIPLHLLLLTFEALVFLLLLRRWSFVKRAFFDAITDCWRLRAHVRAERAQIRQFRRRSDWWMIRFLRLHLNRWDEFIKILKLGLPKVSSS